MKISDLRIAPENPRQTHDPEDVVALADNIAKVGLIYPLVGYEKDGTFQVTNGGRRLAAYKLLAESEDHPKWTPDTAALVRIYDRDYAVELACGEQLSHRSLNDSELFGIFLNKKLSTLSDADLAATLAISQKSVRRMRAVAKLPKAVHDSILQKHINLDQAFGLTYGDWKKDKEHCFKVLDWIRGNIKGFDFQSVRRQFENQNLEMKRIPGWALVDLDAFKKKGGELITDLFTEDVRVSKGSMPLFEKMIADMVTLTINKVFPTSKFISGDYLPKHPGIDMLTDEERKIFEGMDPWNLSDKDQKIYDDFEARSSVLTEEILKRTGVCYSLTFNEDEPIKMSAGAINDESKPALMDAGLLPEYMMPRVDVSIESGDAETPSLSGAMYDRIANIRLEALREHIFDSGTAVTLFLQNLAPPHKGSDFSATHDNMQHLPDEMRQAWFSGNLQKAYELFEKSKGEVAKMPNAARERLLNARILWNLTNHGSLKQKATKAIVLKYFQPTETFWSGYTSPQLRKILGAKWESKNPKIKKKTDLIAAAMEKFADKKFLPLGF